MSLAVVRLIQDASAASSAGLDGPITADGFGRGVIIGTLIEIPVRRVAVSESPFPGFPKVGLTLVETFIARTRCVVNEGELRTLLEDICCALGFRYYALIHHVDLGITRRGVVNINNYPSAWVEYFITSKLYRIDPVLRTTLCTLVGFAWAQMFSLIRRTETDDTILEAARHEGLGEGFTVPFHMPGELPGSCSFATARGRPLPSAEKLLLAQLLGAFAFEAARRLARPANTGQPPVQLTYRQRECLELAALGKTDWEISQILSLSETTVRVHMRAARERYTVCNRTQAVVCALYNGQIGYPELR